MKIILTPPRSPGVDSPQTSSEPAPVEPAPAFPEGGPPASKVSPPGKWQRYTANTALAATLLTGGFLAAQSDDFEGSDGRLSPGVIQGTDGWEKALNTRGISQDTAQSYAQLGVTEAGQVVYLVEQGLTPEEVVAYDQQGHLRYSEMDQLQDLGLNWSQGPLTLQQFQDALAQASNTVPGVQARVLLAAAAPKVSPSDQAAAIDLLLRDGRVLTASDALAQMPQVRVSFAALESQLKNVGAPGDGSELRTALVNVYSRMDSEDQSRALLDFLKRDWPNTTLEAMKRSPEFHVSASDLQAALPSLPAPGDGSSVRQILVTWVSHLKPEEQKTLLGAFLDQGWPNTFAESLLAAPGVVYTADELPQLLPKVASPGDGSVSRQAMVSLVKRMAPADQQRALDLMTARDWPNTVAEARLAIG